VLSIFTPSAIESIGLNFLGHGSASGPAEMLPHDITGLHPQAYWTNVTGPLNGNVGSVAHPLTSSNRPHATITVYWDTSSQWGNAVGDDTPIKRMFDGMATSYGTNEATAQSVTFSNVPPGSHSLLVYSVQIPLEFFSMDFQALTFNSDGTTAVSQRRFIRPQNGDEYRASPGFHLVTAGTPPTLAVGNTLRFDNLQPGDGRIQLRFFSPDRVQPQPPVTTIKGPGVSGLQLLLNPFGVQTRPGNVVYSETSGLIFVSYDPRVQLHGRVHGRAWCASELDFFASHRDWKRFCSHCGGFLAESADAVLSGASRVSELQRLSATGGGTAPDAP
jgi:hypothetical protein